jgi:hypothetical protein
MSYIREAKFTFNSEMPEGHSATPVSQKNDVQHPEPETSKGAASDTQQAIGLDQMTSYAPGAHEGPYVYSQMDNPHELCRTNLTEITSHKDFEDDSSHKDFGNNLPHDDSEDKTSHKDSHKLTMSRTIIPENETSQQSKGKSGFDLETRKSTRVRALTEKGALYQMELNLKRFCQSVKSHQRICGKCTELLANPEYEKALRLRNEVESALNEVLDNFNKMVDLDPDKRLEYYGELVKCETDNRLIRYELTEVLRKLDAHSEKRSVHSRRSGHLKHSSRRNEAKSKASKSTCSQSVDSSRSSKSHHSSSRSGRSSAKSVATLKAEAAASAAELQTKLKFFDQETQQKSVIDKQQSQLEKLRMIRDLEVAQAKIQAISSTDKVDSQSCVGESNIAQNSQPSVIHSPTLNVNASEFFPAPKVNNEVVTEVEVKSPIATPETPIVYEPHVCKSPSANVNESSYVVEQLVKSFGDFVQTSRLPVPEPGVFTGDPLTYPAWRSAFDALIGNHNIPAEQLIHYLKRYLGGDAASCVNSFLLIPTHESYTEALDLLDKHFGDPFTIACAFKTNLESWSKFSGRDAQSLSKFADFLRQCDVASGSVGR